MLVDLDTPYADTTAADLSLALDGPVRPALHVLTLEVPPATVRLRLLGASHQVLIETAGASRSETVACLPGQPPALPREMETDDGRYLFRARVLRLEPAELTDRVDTLRATLADDGYALLGVFPGDPCAVTALRLEPECDGHTLRWETWHSYPQTGELVHTETAVTLA
ncbi:DUF2617 family protein [Plantactinospora sp. KBS50]|uniref:DUF2617 family protein n=1 Tax=Plantactinospora sp. KBS50 TaxID=2024580 RepID=UPI000BAAE1DB|nr:DUF2617 family protein [Plantactinospora sp. KBS50]ASW53029.1 hypothetical protein CIK06_00735 [Plantactinospora sp. KBS50]